MLIPQRITKKMQELSLVVNNKGGKAMYIVLEAAIAIVLFTIGLGVILYRSRGKTQGKDQKYA